MRQKAHKRLLLLASGTTGILLPLAGDDLSQHDASVAIHEGNTGETLAILEAVAHKRLLWLEAALGHLVGLEGVRVLHLLATGLLAHLPLELGNAACGASASHETNWRVSDLDLVRDIQDLDLSIELLGLSQGGVLLVHHHVS